MKWIPLTLALGGLMFSSARSDAQTNQAEAGAKPSSLSFLVKEKSTKSKPVDRWRTDWGSYNQDTHRSKTVEVEIRNFSSLPAKDVKVSVAWLARAREKGDTPYIVHREVKKMEITAKTTFELFESPSVTENRVNYGYGHSSHGYASGSKLIGYVISMEYGGFTYPSYASAGVGEMAKEPKFSSLVEAYRKENDRESSRSSNSKRKRDREQSED